MKFLHLHVRGQGAQRSDAPYCVLRTFLYAERSMRAPYCVLRTFLYAERSMRAPYLRDKN